MRTSRNIHRLPLSALLIAALASLVGSVVACSRQSDQSDSVTRAPGMTYDSLKDLPDFSGWWAWEFSEDDISPGGGPPGPYLHAPFKPELLTKIGELVEAVMDTSTAERPEESDLGLTPVFCSPPVFLGFNGIDIEFLLTPGRVTLADQSGLVRRMMLGRSLPADPGESNAGTSVGHWDGETLVVETTGLNSSRTFLGPIKWGKGMHVVERFSLAEPDVMKIELRMTAPEVFTGPFEHTFTYRRDREHIFYEETSCVENDRSVDPVTRTQRFDMTPPEDLPPPPSE